MKIFGILFLSLTLLGFTAFFEWIPLFGPSEQQNSAEIVYWSPEGDFVYSGGIVSSISGATDVFTGAIAIEEVKTRQNALEGKPRFYLEYPHFSGIPNLFVLSWIQKKITELDAREVLLEGSGSTTYGFDAHFTLTSGNNIGSILYDIHRHDASGRIDEAVKKVFLIKKDGTFIDSALLVNRDNTLAIEALMERMSADFAATFPEAKLLSSETRMQNFVSYLEDPKMAFSGSQVVFFFSSGIFSDSPGEMKELALEYDEISEAILLEPRKTSPAIKNKNPVSPDGKKYVALTFDDGPHGVYTPELLDTLKKKGVSATFFVLGSNAERYPQILERMVNEGHEIANHSYNHQSFNKISRQAIREQIDKTNAAIHQATGITPQLFRPPYGASTPQVVKAVNMSFIMWSVDSRDWQHKNVEKNLKTTLAHVHDGAIILYHDIHRASVDTIAPLIDALRTQGYEFLTTSDLYERYHQTSLLPEQICFSMSNCATQ